MVVTRTALITAPNIAILIIMIRIIVIIIVMIVIIMIITVRSAMRHQLVHDGHFSLSPLSALVTPRPALSSFGLPLQSSSLPVQSSAKNTIQTPWTWTMMMVMICRETILEEPAQ